MGFRLSTVILLTTLFNGAVTSLAAFAATTDEACSSSLQAVVEGLIEDPNSLSLAVESPVAGATRQAPSRWDIFGESFQRQVLENITRDGNRYRALLAADEPHVRFLHDAGFRFSEEAPVVPTLSAVMEHYNQRLNALIRSGIVEESEVLRPARVLRTPEGEYIGVLYGHPMPADAKPIGGPLPDRAFFRLISRGMFPLGEPVNLVVGGRNTFTEHDLAHLSGFLDRPRYMAALRRTLSIPESTTVHAKWTTRLFFATETVTDFKPGGRQPLLDSLELPAESSPSLNSIHRHLASILRSDRARYGDIETQVLEACRQHLLPLGGVARDPITRVETFRRTDREDFNTSLYSIYQILQTQVQNRVDPRHRIETLSRLEMAITFQSATTPEQWVDAIFWRPRRDSVLYHYICKSGIFSGRRLLLNAYCQ